MLVAKESRQLRNGDIVWNTGHQFIASNVRQVEIDGKLVWRYTGTCTEHEANDSIRHTSYNGGTYSQFTHATTL